MCRSAATPFNPPPSWDSDACSSCRLARAVVRVRTSFDARTRLPRQRQRSPFARTDESQGLATDFWVDFGTTRWSGAGSGGRQIAACEVDPLRIDAIEAVRAAICAWVARRRGFVGVVSRR